MNYNNILIFNDKNINIIYKQYNYLFKPSKIAYNKGIIIGKEKFINEYRLFCKKNKLSKNRWLQKILIVYSDLASVNDLRQIKFLFNDLNYKETNYVSIKNLIKLTKNDCYIIGEDIYRLYYLDSQNQKQVLSFNKNVLNFKEISYLLKNKVKNKNIYVLTSEKYIEEIIKKNNLNYFISNKSEFLTKILENRYL